MNKANLAFAVCHLLGIRPPLEATPQQKAA
jgi:hypothetical protein